jgi:hypothetical protein
LAVFCLLLGLGEVLLRIDRLTSRLAAPSLGSEHHQFEIQLARLEAAYEREGAIDCIFVGDSLVWLDLDPLKFSDGYRDASGKELQCFNFGIAALPASGVSVLTKILVEEYHPHLVVYGLHANSVVVPQDATDTNIVLDTPWVRYKSGSFNPSGWLYEHSYLVRYLKTLNRVMRLDPDALINEQGTTAHQLLGFDPKNGQRIDINIPPSRNNPADINGFEKYYKYHIYPENITGIQSIAEISDNDIKVVMVVMPISRSFYAFFENGKEDYSHITDVIQHALADTDTVLVQTDGQILLSDSDWWDYSHLNFGGAEQFSYWLGDRV